MPSVQGFWQIEYVLRIIKAAFLMPVQVAFKFTIFRHPTLIMESSLLYTQSWPIFKIHFRHIFPFNSRSSKLFLSVSFSRQILSLFYAHLCYMYLLYFISKKKKNEYSLRNFLRLSTLRDPNMLLRHFKFMFPSKGDKFHSSIKKDKTLTFSTFRLIYRF